MENDLDRIKLMNSLLLSMPGSPIIYYGDEIGMGDNIFLGDRNGVRTPMQWSPDRNAGFSRADPQRLYLPPIMDPIYGYEAVNVEAQARDASSLLNWMRRMLAVRKTSQAFGRGTLRVPAARATARSSPTCASTSDDAILVRRQPRRARRSRSSSTSRAYKGRVPVEMLGRTAVPADRRAALPADAAGLRLLLVPPRRRRRGAGLAPGRRRPARTCRCWCCSTAGPASSATASMPWRIGMAERMRTQFETDMLPRFIEIQRWYARQGRGRSSARASSTMRCGSATAAAGCCRWSRSTGRRRRRRYFVPLALAWEEHDEERLQPPRAGRAWPRCGSRPTSACSPTRFADEAFCRALVAAIGAGTRAADRAAARCASRPTDAFARARRRDARRAAGRAARRAEQQHRRDASARRLFLKALPPRCARHQPRARDRPLPHRGRALPALRAGAGRARVRRRRRPHRRRWRCCRRYVTNQGDGWAYTLDYLERFLEELRTRPMRSAPARRRRARRLPRADADARPAHRASCTSRSRAAPAIRRSTPSRSAPEDVAAMREHARADARRTLGPAARAPAAAAGAARSEDAQALLAQRERAASTRIARARAPRPRRCKTRYPRRLPPGPGAGRATTTSSSSTSRASPRAASRSAAPSSSPLRDVAGMLRSFNYARWRALAARGAERRRAAAPGAPRARLGGAQRATPSSRAYAETVTGRRGLRRPVDAAAARAVRARKGAVRAALRTEQPPRLGPGPAAGPAGAAAATPR